MFLKPKQMISAQELRIGNWVKDRGGKYIRIDFFEHLQKEYSCKFGMNHSIEGWGEVHPLTEYTEYAEPIPLTPEILIKAGFSKGADNNGNLEVYRKGKYTVAWWGTKWQFWTNTFDVYNSPQHLHQLQNIIFALAGQELEVKF